MSEHMNLPLPMPSTNGPAQAANKTVSPSTPPKGAGRLFREFKWGLLTLFLLMAVVIGLIYDGRRKREPQPPAAPAAAQNQAGPRTAGPGGDGLGGAYLMDAQPSTGPGARSAAPGAVQDSVLADVAPPPNGNELAPAAEARYEVLSGETLLSISQKLYGPRAQSGFRALCAANQDLFQNPKDLRPGMKLRVPPLAPLPTRSAAGPAVATRPHTAQNPAVETARPAVEKAPRAAGGDETYLVQSGDTLEGISRRHYADWGAGMKAIQAANDGLSDPRKLRASATIRLPALKAGETPKAETGSAAPHETSDGYVVQPGDTLERIARKLFQDGARWRDLYELNRDQLPDPSRLRVGQKLKISDGERKPVKTSDSADAAFLP